jgi:endoglucanase
VILNNMMLMCLAHDIGGDVEYLDSVRLSMDYLVGRNPVNMSYVSGYGTYSMQHPHHRFWANLPADGYPPPPPGAVSGGPNSSPSDDAAAEVGLSNLPPSKRYLDVIGSYSTNEVTINWNASLAWVATFLDEKRDWTPSIDETEPEEPSVPAWVIVLAGVLVAVVGVFWFRRKQRSRDNSTPGSSVA